MTTATSVLDTLPLQAARRERGWDVATLAREADVGIEVAARAEMGEAVRPEELRAMLDAVGIAPPRAPCRPRPST